VRRSDAEFATGAHRTRAHCRTPSHMRPPRARRRQESAAHEAEPVATGSAADHQSSPEPKSKSHPTHRKVWRKKIRPRCHPHRWSQWVLPELISGGSAAGKKGSGWWWLGLAFCPEPPGASDARLSQSARHVHRVHRRSFNQQ
jgi:hypothetical protein